jgi:hypothetical protein
MDFDKESRSEVLEVTKRLLGREEDDRRELKRLHRELKLVKDTTLWDLLVELMERDTEKHIAMLEFARKHATRHVCRASGSGQVGALGIGVLFGMSPTHVRPSLCLCHR